MKEYLDGVESWIEKYRYKRENKNDTSEFDFEEPDYPLYGNSILTKVRIGQGALPANFHNYRSWGNGVVIFAGWVSVSANNDCFYRSNPDVSTCYLLRGSYNKYLG